MRCGTDKPVCVGAVAHDDFVYNIFDTSGIHSDNRDYRHLITQTLFNKSIEQRFARNGRA